MDQGNTDPNNPTPEPLTPPSAFGATPVSAPTPSSVSEQPFATPPSSPVSPLESVAPVGGVSGSNWANPTAVLSGESPVPAAVPIAVPASVPAAEPAQEANPFNPSAPTTLSSFPTSGTGSTPPPVPKPISPSPGPVSSEAVPTDLSNLVNTTASEATSYMPLPQAPESIVVPPPPQATGDEVNQAVSASGGKGFPKIVFIIGGIILLVVIGASAYFILGIGKASEPLPVSVPAEQQLVPTPAIKASPTPTASTQSGSFSNLPGNPTVTPSTGGSKSAYETLMQQRQVASTGSANP